MSKKKLSLIIGFFGLYLFFAGASYAAFSYLNQEPGAVISPLATDSEMGNLLVDNTGPRTQACPLNGQAFTKAEEKIWENRRPLLVMIENHLEARPQSGLSSADIVYEVIAEGGITRFMAVFYCDAVAREALVGPVRSARTYFLDWASEYGSNPLYVHVGGAHCEASTLEGCLSGAKADALGQIQKYGWGGRDGNDVNQFSVGFPTFWRDYERLGRTVATEHTMYSTTEKLWALAAKRSWTNVNQDGEGEWDDEYTAWQFDKQEAAAAERGSLTNVDVTFWEGHSDYQVAWQYDKANNQFLRFNGGQPHKDLNTDQQLAVKNVVVQLTKELRANDGYPGNLHLLYQTIGSGKAFVFKNGQVVEAKWSKASLTDRTIFTDTYGKEISFVPGKIWLSTLPLNGEVKF